MNQMHTPDTFRLTDIQKKLLDTHWARISDHLISYFLPIIMRRVDDNQNSREWVSYFFTYTLKKIIHESPLDEQDRQYCKLIFIHYPPKTLANILGNFFTHIFKTPEQARILSEFLFVALTRGTVKNLGEDTIQVFIADASGLVTKFVSYLEGNTSVQQHLKNVLAHLYPHAVVALKTEEAKRQNLQTHISQILHKLSSNLLNYEARPFTEKDLTILSVLRPHILEIFSRHLKDNLLIDDLERDRLSEKLLSLLDEHIPSTPLVTKKTQEVTIGIIETSPTSDGFEILSELNSIQRSHIFAEWLDILNNDGVQQSRIFAQWTRIPGNTSNTQNRSDLALSTDQDFRVNHKLLDLAYLLYNLCFHGPKTAYDQLQSYHTQVDIFALHRELLATIEARDLYQPLAQCVIKHSATPSILTLALPQSNQQNIRLTQNLNTTPGFETQLRLATITDHDWVGHLKKAIQSPPLPRYPDSMNLDTYFTLWDYEELSPHFQYRVRGNKIIIEKGERFPWESHLPDFPMTSDELQSFFIHLSQTELHGASSQLRVRYHEGYAHIASYLKNNDTNDKNLLIQNLHDLKEGVSLASMRLAIGADKKLYDQFHEYYPLGTDALIEAIFKKLGYDLLLEVNPLFAQQENRRRAKESLPHILEQTQKILDYCRCDNPPTQSIEKIHGWISDDSLATPIDDFENIIYQIRLHIAPLTDRERENLCKNEALKTAGSRDFLQLLREINHRLRPHKKPLAR